ncbi:glycosyltransferase family 39 protein [Patescibacteria group bacterium]
MPYIFLGIFIISIVFSFVYHIKPTTDAKAYNAIAINLAEGRGYIENIDNINIPTKDDAIIRVGPGYEFFLAGLYKIFGNHLWVVWFFQVLLRVITAFFLFKLSLEIFGDNLTGERIGLIAAVIFGLTPDLIIMGGMLLAETLFLTLLIISAYFSLKLLSNNKTWYLWIVGFMWGITMLVRPTALPMMLFFIGFLLYQKRLKFAFIVFLISIICVGSWSVRNSLLFDRPLFTTTAGPIALWVGNNEFATGGYDKSPAIQKIISENHSTDLGKIAMKEYFSFLIEHPIQFSELQIRKTVMYFSLIRPTGFWFYLGNKPIQRLLTLGASAFGTAFLFIMGCAGLFLFYKNYKNGSIKKHFLIGLIALQPLVVIPTYVETRYRSPFLLFLALFAAYFLFQYFRRYKILFASLLVFIIFTLYDIWYNYIEISEKINVVLSNIL